MPEKAIYILIAKDLTLQNAKGLCSFEPNQKAF